MFQEAFRAQTALISQPTTFVFTSTTLGDESEAFNSSNNNNNNSFNSSLNSNINNNNHHLSSSLSYTLNDPSAEAIFFNELILDNIFIDENNEPTANNHHNHLTNNSTIELKLNSSNSFIDFNSSNINNFNNNNNYSSNKNSSNIDAISELIFEPDFIINELELGNLFANSSNNNSNLIYTESSLSQEAFAKSLAESSTASIMHQNGYIDQDLADFFSAIGDIDSLSVDLKCDEQDTRSVRSTTESDLVNSPSAEVTYPTLTDNTTQLKSSVSAADLSSVCSPSSESTSFLTNEDEEASNQSEISYTSSSTSNASKKLFRIGGGGSVSKHRHSSKRESNKAAANRYRIKKITEKETLFEECELYEKKNNELRRQIDDTQSEINCIKNLLVEALLARKK